MRLSAVLCALLFLLAGLPGGPEPARADGDPLLPWRDVARLKVHLEQACDAVEAACGASFARRPGVRVSTQAEVERILQLRDHVDRGIGEQMPHAQRSFIAYYEPVAEEIHILPEELGRTADLLGAPELLDEDVLRVILVHEATHALDFQRFPMKWTLACCARSDERLAIEAVLEGHAQLVGEQVSREWGIEGAFQRLTRLYTGAYQADGDFDQEAAFAYLQGHAFMRAILGARGQDGLAAALLDPPCETRIIDRPLLWLEPQRLGTEPDLQATLEVFRPLVRDPTWEVSKWRLLGSSVEELTEAHMLEGSDFDGYVDNHGLYAASPDGSRYLNVFIVSWDTPAQARRFAAALAHVDRRRDEEPGWDPTQRHQGAGTEYALDGFTSVRQMEGAGADALLAVQVAQAERHVIEVSTWGMPASDLDAKAAAVDVAARLLARPPADAAARHLRQEIQGLFAARDAKDYERARIVLRDLLPADADLRRVVRPALGTAFAEGYRGHKLELRTTHVETPLMRNVFGGAGSDATVTVEGASTETLARGGPSAAAFPPEMQAFARDVAHPGVLWFIVAVATAGDAQPKRYGCFARLGDRFLWIVDPWKVIG